MKCIKIIFTVLFAIILLVPIAAFNFDEDAVSAIDNRQLAQNPLEVDGDLTQNIQDYVNDRIGLRYLDNTAVLREKFEEGIMVFNQKYDANHWNDWGAYYGTQAMLEELRKDLPSIHITQTEELDISETLETSLPVSEFPINEMVPAITVKTPVQNISGVYSKELELNPSYKTFGYYVNQTRLEEGAPRALVFQGSYMNVYGYKYMANSFGEYIHVHDYQNVMDFSYYYNIFQPDCVIFEVAEYTFLNMYFNYESMCAMQLNPG